MTNIQLFIFQTLYHVNVVHNPLTSHCSFDPPFGVTFAYIRAFVVGFFPFADRKLQLDKLFPSIQANRHQCQAFCAIFPDERADFPFAEEEFAWTTGFVLGILMGVLITWYQCIGQIELISFHCDEASFEAGVACFDRLYFGSGQHQTSLVTSVQGIIETSSSVGCYDCHNGTSTVAKEWQNSNFSAI